MIEAKLLRKKLKNGLIVDKWDLVTIIEKQQAEIDTYKLQNNNQIDTYRYKNLTDEEIHEIAEYHGIDSLYETGRLDFARAILRKAQDK